MEYVIFLLGAVAILNGMIEFKRSDDKTRKQGKLLILGGVGMFVCSVIMFSI